MWRVGLEGHSHLRTDTLSCTLSIILNSLEAPTHIRATEHDHKHYTVQQGYSPTQTQLGSLSQLVNLGQQTKENK